MQRRFPASPTRVSLARSDTAVSLRDRLRRLLDAEARVEPLKRPSMAVALDPLAGSPKSQMVEREIHGLDAEGRAADEVDARDADA